MRRIDGRVVIAVMVMVGVVFVILNLLLGGGPGGVRVFDRPTSPPAVVGATGRIGLLSRCAPAVDFDRSYWTPPGRWRLDQPAEPATITLVSRNRATLVTASGQRISLIRHDPPLRLSRCQAPSP